MPTTSTAASRHLVCSPLSVGSVGSRERERAMRVTAVVLILFRSLLAQRLFLPLEQSIRSKVTSLRKRPTEQIMLMSCCVHARHDRLQRHIHVCIWQLRGAMNELLRVYYI